MATKTSKTAAVNYEARAQLFRAFADPIRLRIVDLLRKELGGMTVTEIVERLVRTGRGISQPTVSHHLSILVRAGVVGREQRGVFGVHTFNRAPSVELAGLLNGW